MKILIDDNTLDNLAELSLLEFSIDEKKEIQKELNGMLSFFDVIHNVQIDALDVEPYNTNVQTQNLRQDEPQKKLTKKQALSNATNHNEDFFLVPKILGSKS